MEGLDVISETAGAVAVEAAVSALVARGAPVVHCRNCGTPLIGAYCAACGQPAISQRRSLPQLVTGVFRGVGRFDGRILKTGRALLLQPGELPLAFREGRTQRYVPPVRLYLFTSLIFFLVLAATRIAILQLEVVANARSFVADRNGNVVQVMHGKRTVLEGLKADKDGNVYADDGDGTRVSLIGMKADGMMHQDIDTKPLFFSHLLGEQSVSPDVRAAIQRDDQILAKLPQAASLGAWLRRHVNRTLDTLAVNPAAINEPLTLWIPRVLFILLPIYALVLAVFYWRQRGKFLFIDHLVFSLNAHGIVFATILVAIGLASLIGGAAAALAALVAIGVYIFLATKRAYGQGWFWTSVKFISVSFVYTMFFLIPALLTIFIVSVLNL